MSLNLAVAFTAFTLQSLAVRYQHLNLKKYMAHERQRILGCFHTCSFSPVKLDFDLLSPSSGVVRLGFIQADVNTAIKLGSRSQQPH